MFTRFFFLVIFSSLNECFVKFYAKAESTTSNAPINVEKKISAAAGERVKFPCEKPSSWANHEGASWVQLTAKDGAQCAKGFKRIDDYLWFCDVLVNNRIVQSDFRERFSLGPLGSAEENHMTLKSATSEDTGRYICFSNRTKDIVKIYNLTIYFATTTVSLQTNGLRMNSTSFSGSSESEIPVVLIFACLFAAVCFALALVVCILIGKLRKANREILKYRNSLRVDARQRNFEDPNYEESIEALNSNTANDDNQYMGLERTQVNQQRSYETIALDRSGQNAAI